MKKRYKKPGPNEPLGKTRYMGIVITADQRERIVQIAEREGRSLSNVIRMLIREALFSRDYSDRKTA